MGETEKIRQADDEQQQGIGQEPAPEPSRRDTGAPKDSEYKAAMNLFGLRRQEDAETGGCREGSPGTCEGVRERVRLFDEGGHAVPRGKV